MNSLIKSTIKEALSNYRNIYQAPGMGFLYSNEENSYENVVGLKNVTKGNHRFNQITENSIWGIGSCTKSMTATLLTKFIEEGYFDWSSTLGDVVDAINKERSSNFVKISPNLRNVHLENVLTHTGGIPDPYPYEDMNFNKSIENFLESGTGGDTENFQYSSIGFSTLAYLEEQLSGMRWDDFVRKNLFEPLGMDHCLIQPEVFTPSPLRDLLLMPLIPNAHVDGVPEFFNKPNHFEKANIAGGAAVLCPLNDWNKYLRYLIRGYYGEVDADAKPISKKENFQHLFNIKSEVNYSYGAWQLENSGDENYYYHNGSNGGFIVLGTVDISKREVNLVVTNGDELSDFGSLHWIMQDIRNQIHAILK